MIDLIRLFDPASFLLVGGATFAAAALRCTREDLSSVRYAMRPLLRGIEDITEDAQHALARVEWVAAERGVACTDRVETGSEFLHEAVLNLADTPSADQFAGWAKREVDSCAARYDGALAFWRSVADVAPAMGMVGTVLGLIGMFAAMNDPAAMGPAMALALLTTLYGIVIGPVLAGSIAGRLERLAAAELKFRDDALARLEAVARQQAPDPRDWLKKRSRVPR
jgi:chemotaxis protein MotA